MAFTPTASGYVSDIWVAMWYVPIDGQFDEVTVRLALDPAGKPPKPEDLPKILDDDKVNMDLWHYQDGLLQTMQAKRPDPAVATLSAVYHEDGKRALVLGTTKSPSVRLITADGSRALTQDNSRYEKMISWDGRYQDYYLVNTIDGSRQMIIEGLRGSASSSPEGRFVVWFDHRDYHWHAHDVATGKQLARLLPRMWRP